MVWGLNAHTIQQMNQCTNQCTNIGALRGLVQKQKSFATDRFDPVVGCDSHYPTGAAKRNDPGVTGRLLKGGSGRILARQRPEGALAPAVA